MIKFEPINIFRGAASAILLALAALHGKPVIASDFAVPPGPARPNYSGQCSLAFDPPFRASLAISRQCTSQCSKIPGFPGDRWQKAYIGCYDSCRAASNARMEQVKAAREACFARVPSPAGIPGRDMAIEQGMKLGNEVYRAARTTFELLTDPAEFLVGKLRKRMPDLYTGLMKSRDANGQEGLAAEVFKYSVTQAEAGIDAADHLRANGKIIAAIQTESLNRIVSMYMNVIDEHQLAINRVDQFLEAEKTSMVSAPSVRVNVPRVSGRLARTPECSVVNDPPRFQRLLDGDEQGALELLARCKPQ